MDCLTQKEMQSLNNTCQSTKVFGFGNFPPQTWVRFASAETSGFRNGLTQRYSCPLEFLYCFHIWNGFGVRKPFFFPWLCHWPAVTLVKSFQLPEPVWLLSVLPIYIAMVRDCLLPCVCTVLNAREHSFLWGSVCVRHARLKGCLNSHSSLETYTMCLHLLAVHRAQSRSAFNSRTGTSSHGFTFTQEHSWCCCCLYYLSTRMQWLKHSAMKGKIQERGELSLGAGSPAYCRAVMPSSEAPGAVGHKLD